MRTGERDSENDSADHGYGTHDEEGTDKRTAVPWQVLKFPNDQVAGLASIAAVVQPAVAPTPGQDGGHPALSFSCENAHEKSLLLLVFRVWQIFSKHFGQFPNFWRENKKDYDPKMKRTRDGEAKGDQQDDAIEVIDESRAAQNVGNATADKSESAKSEATTPQPAKRARKQADLTPEEILPRLILRRIIKENHGSPIKQIAFNFTKRSNYNLVATVGGNQVSHPRLSPSFFHRP